MAINWTVEYEAQPKDGSNPGFIAQSVRTLKTAVSERLVLEHFFGAAESSDYGKHKEGGARFFVEDDESAGRTDRVTSDTYVGRGQIDLNEMSSQPDIDGVAQTGILNRTLKIWDKDGSLQTVFDPTAHVSTIYDQIITGRKSFTDENPEVQEALDDTTYDAMDAPTQVRADEKAVKRSGIKVWTEEAREYNIFDSTDTDNPTTADTDSPTDLVTLRNIECQSIYATEVRGAVYA